MARNRDIEFVRVRIKESGIEKSIPASKWEANRDAFAKLPRVAAVDTNGDPLPDSTSGADVETQDGQSAETTEEK